MHQRTNQFARTRRGYTLIEMLLVIGILAMIAAMSVAMIRRHAQSERLNLTALDMQQLAQASQNYYLNPPQDSSSSNTSWPCANNQDFDPQFISNYVPKGLLLTDGLSNITGPFGANFSCRYQNNTDEANDDPSQNDYGNLTIILSIPSTVPDAQNQADQLAGLLPGGYPSTTASNDTKNCPIGPKATAAVCMDITPPTGGGATSSAVNIAAMGTCLSDGSSNGTNRDNPIANATCQTASASNGANPCSCPASTDSDMGSNGHAQTAQDAPYQITFNCAASQTGYVFFNMAGLYQEKSALYTASGTTIGQYSRYDPTILTDYGIGSGNYKNSNDSDFKGVIHNKSDWSGADSTPHGAVKAHLLTDNKKPYNQLACACFGSNTQTLEPYQPTYKAGKTYVSAKDSQPYLRLMTAGSTYSSGSWGKETHSPRDANNKASSAHIALNYTAICVNKKNRTIQNNLSAQAPMHY